MSRAKRYERLVRAYGPSSTFSTSTAPSKPTIRTPTRGPKDNARAGNNSTATTSAYTNTTNPHKRKQDAYADEEDAAADDDEEYETQSPGAMAPPSLSPSPLGASTPYTMESSKKHDRAASSSHGGMSSEKLIEKNNSMAKYLNDRQAASSGYVAVEKDGGYFGPGNAAGYKVTPSTYSGGILGPRFLESHRSERDYHNSMAFRGPSMPFSSTQGSDVMEQYYQPSRPLATSDTMLPSRYHGGAFGTGVQQPQQLFHFPKRQKTQHEAASYFEEA